MEKLKIHTLDGMSFTEKYAELFRKFLPTPFTIALILTVIAFVLVLAFGDDSVILSKNTQFKFLAVLDIWYEGLWDKGGFAFSVQMMLMLLLGHVVALSIPVKRLLNVLSKWVTNTASAAFMVTFFTILVSLFNWGLGLVFGALFARTVAEKAAKERWELNYGLIGACGYIGLMVWHGGLSGSAPIKVADEGHLLSLMQGNNFGGQLPVSIPMSETVFSSMNVFSMILLLLILPSLGFILGKKVKTTKISIQNKLEIFEEEKPIGAEKIDSSVWLGRVLGLGILTYAVLRVQNSDNILLLKFLTPDFINFSLLGFALIFHGSINKLLQSVGEAIGGVSGILLQFPLYYGIMALMQHSGLLSQFADSLTTVAGNSSFPLMTLFSAGAMNVFVPSGGGQWVVQGPVIIETAMSNGLSLSKGVMAMSYGDQLTNMLQPFWALPLLAITGLKAKEILPYTLIFMAVGVLIFGSVLILF